MKIISTNLLRYLYLAYFLGLILATYSGLAEIYIILCFLFFVGKAFYTNKSIYIKKNIRVWICFIAYYFLVSVIGLATNHVGLNSIAEFLIKLVLLPVSIILLINNNNLQTNIKDILLPFRTFIIVAALYGVVETIIKHNYLYNFIIIDARNWIINMNGAERYQPSSLFLHYNYYGFVLLFGLLLIYIYPISKQYLDVPAKLLLFIQLVLCGSRIAWLAFVVCLFVILLYRRTVTNKAIMALWIVVFFLVIIIIIDPTILSKLGHYFYDRFANIFEYGLKDGSLGQRLGTLMNWPQYFNSNPFKAIIGTGYGSIFVEFMPSYSYFSGFSTADSVITITLVEAGVIGFSLLVLAYIITLKHIINNLYLVLAITVIIIEGLTLDLVANNFILPIIIATIIICFLKDENDERTVKR